MKQLTHSTTSNFNMSNFSKKIYSYFDIAKKASLESDHDRFNIGAIVVYNGKIISTGFSSNKSHPLQMRLNEFRLFSPSCTFIHNHSIHAEVMAITNASKILSENEFKNIKLFVYRTVKKTGLYGMCRPCKGCMELINRKKIKHIYYTTDVGYAYEQLIYN